MYWAVSFKKTHLSAEHQQKPCSAFCFVKLLSLLGARSDKGVKKRAKEDSAVLNSPSVC